MAVLRTRPVDETPANGAVGLTEHGDTCRVDAGWFLRIRVAPAAWGCTWPFSVPGSAEDAKFITVPVGYPNFYFALSQQLDWTPQPDGFLLVKEMKLKG
jgi:hypothetical protein